MDDHGNMPLRDPDAAPTGELLERILGGSYPAYEAFQEALAPLEIEQEWQWYTPYKVWFARGQHFWTTKRGTKKEKTLYWLYVYEGYFSIAVWFKEKNRAELLAAGLEEKTRQRISDAGTMGKLPTFPVGIDITGAEALGEVYTLLDWKKKLEL